MRPYQALKPPREEAVNSTISLCYEVGTVEGDEELTPLGHHLAKLPVDVLVGNVCITYVFSPLYSKCNILKD
ncbi:hypothetical protein Pint_32994 [Pistacia integerrima]|uniref:Uncharacterized protein n=1 Tax=Pistacia integerrima TaxID=434235 RepID=A0ACC0X9R6_9ROSI|nr:hypothetical protein Pint_32994 [Pistacia integerrima]